MWLLWSLFLHFGDDVGNFVYWIFGDLVKNHIAEACQPVTDEINEFLKVAGFAEQIVVEPTATFKFGCMTTDRELTIDQRSEIELHLQREFDPDYTYFHIRVSDHNW